VNPRHRRTPGSLYYVSAPQRRFQPRKAQLIIKPLVPVASL
jgi:hypothetical protein